MSITSDIKSYADTALEQGKQVLDQAQAQFNDVTGQANELVGKLTEKVDVSGLTSKANELKAQAEKVVEPVVERVTAQAKPYLERAEKVAQPYLTKAEELFKQVSADPRVKQVVETVETKVVNPALSLIGRAPAKHAAKPAAAKPTTAKKVTPKPAAKPTARKVTAKAPVKKATARKVTK